MDLIKSGRITEDGQLEITDGIKGNLNWSNRSFTIRLYKNVLVYGELSYEEELKSRENPFLLECFSHYTLKETEDGYTIQLKVNLCEDKKLRSLKKNKHTNYLLFIQKCKQQNKNKLTLPERKTVKNYDEYQESFKEEKVPFSFILYEDDECIILWTEENAVIYIDGCKLVLMNAKLNKPVSKKQQEENSNENFLFQKLKEEEKEKYHNSKNRHSVNKKNSCRRKTG